MGLVAGPIKFIVEFPYKWLPLCCSFLRQLLTRPTSCTSQTEGMIFPETLVPMKWKGDFWNIPRIALGLLKWSSLPRKPLCPLSQERNRRKSRQSESWFFFFFFKDSGQMLILRLTWEINKSTCHSQWAAGSVWPYQAGSLTHLSSSSEDFSPRWLSRFTPHIQRRAWSNQAAPAEGGTELAQPSWGVLMSCRLRGVGSS